MAHNNGMVPKGSRKARSAKAVSANAAKFRAAARRARQTRSISILRAPCE
jgi:hypothetical protein